MNASSVIGLVVAFAVLLVVFRLIELRRPHGRRLPLLRRGFWTDLSYWLFTPLVTKTATRIAVGLAILPVALIVYGRFDTELIRHGFGPAAPPPLWLQAIAIVTIGDLIGYWMHRAFHGRRLWDFHAVHHSPEELDWLSAVRLHPVNDAGMRIVTTLPVLALGFAPLAVAAVVPFLTLMAILVHANVDWDWGPLRAVVASPRFHRWHHADEQEARDTNFAGLLPFWDVLFGTYYMPPDRMPARFGTATPVPAGLIGQLRFPFRRDRTTPQASFDRARYSAGETP